MLRLIRAMLRARRGSAVAVLLLAAVAAGAAAAAPLYRGAAERSILSAELATAPASDQVITRTWLVSNENGSAPPDEERAQPADRPGFDTIRGLRVDGTLSGTDQVALLARTEVCAELSIVEGRCASAPQEIVVSTAAAARRGLTVGGALRFQPVRLDRLGAVVPAGPPIALRVVGLATPPDPTTAYWAGRTPATATGAAADLLLATPDTLRLARTPVLQVHSDLLARPSTFDDEGSLRSAVQAEFAAGSQLDYSVATTIPDLLDRVAANRRALASNLVVGAVPLVGLCWYVLYLAITAGLFRRRDEFALTGLRGTPGPARFWLGAVDYLIPIVIGAPLGYLAGWALLAATSAGALPGDPAVQPGWGSVLAAVTATGGAVVAGLVAQQRVGRQPVAALLRRVPRRRATRAAAAGFVVVLAATAAATYQVTLGEVGGLPAFAPVLIAVTGGLVAARAVAVTARAGGRRALRRGRIGAALRGLHLARRPGQVGLVALLVAVLAVVGFVAAARDAAERARTDRIRAELGTSTEVEVAPVPLTRLLAAVRAADPQGRAAAVARLAGPGDVPLLAVDAPRLARVALWDPDAPAPADRAAAALRPAEPAVLAVPSTTVEVVVDSVPGHETAVVLTARLLTPGGEAVSAPLGETTPGLGTYRAEVPACAAGCRLLSVLLDPRGTSYDIDLTVRSVAGNALSSEAGWQVRPTVQGGQSLAATPTVTGLHLTYRGDERPDSLLAPVALAGPVPVLATATTTVPDGALRRADGPAPVTLPGLGGTGAMVDLESYALAVDLSPTSASTAPSTDRAAVWLAADAPPDILQRLGAAGLIVLGQRTYASTVERSDAGGPALALRFFLGVLVVASLVGAGAVAVVAGAEHQHRTAELRALRQQGLRAGTLWRIGLGGQLGLTVTAVGSAIATAALAWWLTRGALTPFVDRPAVDYTPDWPDPAAALLAVGGAGLVPLAAGVVAAVIGLRAVARPERPERRVRPERPERRVDR